MNVLFVSSALNYFESSATNRNRALVNQLATLGCNVYSVEFSADGGQVISNLNIKDEYVVTIPGFRSSNSSFRKGNHRWSLKSLAKPIFRRVIPDTLFTKIWRLDFSQGLSEFDIYFDLIITSSDPKGVHLFSKNPTVMESKYLKGAKWVQYWGDPLCGDVNGHDNWILRWLEKYLFRSADSVYLVSKPTMEEKIRDYPGLRDKFKYLPRFMPEPDHKIPVISGQKGVSACYVGDFNKKSRDINPLISAFAGQVLNQLVIVGNGDCDIPDVPSAVNLRGRLPQVQAEEVIANSDVCFVILNKYGSQIPGKIFDLAVTNKTVIVLYESHGQIRDIPFKERFVFCKNDTSSIKEDLAVLENLKWSHAVDEYLVADRVVNEILANLDE